ncbi:MAG: glycoside hydrolase family 127 protein [Prevotella sp.]|nr:glycoside hydrolase family 127 protein [Prevotella sp.]
MNQLLQSLFITLLAVAPVLPLSASRTIKKVEPVSVQCPVGTSPRLPNRLWVTYRDGRAEYRQVRWMNAPLTSEEDEADARRHPAGLSYRLKGYVVGDNTTDNGYPVEAIVRVVGEPQPTPVREKAVTFPLSAVTINGDNRLSHNRDEALKEICSWDVTQQLYNYRDTYNLPTTGYTTSDGWDSPDTKLKGHGSGHYMSAIAQAYAVTKDPKQKAILKANITRMVNELRACQEKTFVWNDSLGRYWEARDFAPEQELKDMKGTWAAFDEYKKRPERYGYGYLNAIPAQHCALIEMYRPYNNSDWVWAPYYSIHKQLAGLIDIATYMDDKAIADKALLIAKDMGLWVWNRMHYRTYVKKDGTQQERRARPGNRYEMWDMYIAGEVGGMQESLSRLAEMVSDKADSAKLMEAAQCFDAPKFYEPLAQNIDDIRTRHANQHIPMIVGALRSYRNNHKPYYYHIAENFWQLVEGRYLYATGGVGNGEMFRQPYTQVLSMATNGMQEGEAQANPDLNETCCTYNLLKLTKDLNAYNPDKAAYMDYYERGLYNQIVGSLNPDKYQTTYQYAVGLNATKPFGNETPQSTCCGGTGSENHTKYQQAVYFHNDSTLWVGLYMPTTLQWTDKQLTLTQDCTWPAERSVLKVDRGEGDFALKLRVPYWATSGFKVLLNGKNVQKHYQPSSYVTIPYRHWTTADRVEVVMPFTIHIEYGMDKLPAEVASADGTPLKSAWTGVVMVGPLCMTGTNVATWRQATLSTDDIDKATVVPAQGQEPITVTIDGKRFEPDYYRNAHSTHYYRLESADGAGSKQKADRRADLTELQSLVALADKRVSEQTRWMGLTKKVPDYAPWAPHGYERMQEALAQARGLMQQKARHLDADAVETVTTSLSKAINTMRPGNLAEVEDLHPLTTLLRRIGTPDSTAPESLRKAVDYGQMVVRYVMDGSGTKDMINAAVERLKKEW